MQIHIAVNDALINEVLAITEFNSTQEAIEQGLKLLLQLKQQEKIKAAQNTLSFAQECQRQSLQLSNDANEKEINQWLELAADTEGWE